MGGIGNQPTEQKQLAYLKWLLLFILNPQEQHGLNNALLRALLAKHPLTATDPEDNNHIHINNLAWAIYRIGPAHISRTESAAQEASPQTYPQAYTSDSSEEGTPLEASDTCIYLETEKHIICLVNDWLSDASHAITEYKSLVDLAQLQKIKPQDKQALVFYIGNDKTTEATESPAICQLTNQELGESFHKILEKSSGAINMPGNNRNNKLLPLIDMLFSGQLLEQLDKLEDAYNEFAMSHQPQNKAEYPHADLYIKRLQELRDQQTNKLAQQNVTAHCWLWYPLKFANRKLADGLPFVVYEIEQESIGKITLDLHYYVADDATSNSKSNSKKNYWRMDVFRRPNRQGPDLEKLLEECGIEYHDIDKHEHYVAKYIVIKQDEADDLPAAQLTQSAIQIQSQVDEVIHKLISAR